MDGTDLARDLMLAFAEATGLRGRAAPRRYLWTDAFAACNFLGLHRASGDEEMLALARKLVEQVHDTLGRYREDDERSGWISGLPEAEGARRPTARGLRIGKPLPERRESEPFDPALEWERDGQYLHYLTKWMHALNRMAAETGEGRYHAQAVDLARATHAAFTFPAGESGRKRLVWKMSVDLKRPLVPSMGHHDPLDALVSYLELEAADSPGEGMSLAAEIADMEVTCEGTSWATEDALGIGGLLTDVARLSGLPDRRRLLPGMLGDAVTSLRAWQGTDALRLPPSHRLPFRELGLAIGLHATDRARGRLAAEPGRRAALEAIERFLPVARAIEAAWSPAEARRARTWSEHEDINAVMLATSLSPEGFLGE